MNTRTYLHRGRAYIVVTRVERGWRWMVHESIPHHGGMSKGPLRHHGTAPFKRLAILAARCHADRIVT